MKIIYNVLLILLLVLTNMSCMFRHIIVQMRHPDKLSSKIEKVRLKRIEYACICPNWVRYPGAGVDTTLTDLEHIYLEPADSIIAVSGDYWHSVAYKNNWIEFTGSYYTDIGVGRGYYFEHPFALEHAQVFRYTKWDVVKPFELYFDYDTTDASFKQRTIK